MFLKILFSIFLVPSFSHDFHVSITTAEYDEETRNLEITMKVFTEDLEMVLENDIDAELNLGEPSENPDTDSLLFDYLKKHFFIKDESKVLPYQFVGKEIEQNHTYLYLEILDMEKPKEWRIKNTFFFKEFADQSNIINLKIGTEIRSVFLETSQPEKVIIFKPPIPQMRN